MLNLSEKQFLFETLLLYSLLLITMICSYLPTSRLSLSQRLTTFQFGSETQLSSFTTASSTVICYLLTVYLLKQWIQRRGKTFDLRKVTLDKSQKQMIQIATN